MDPSSFMISQMTPAGASPAMRVRSTAASVCPARRNTPPGRALRGKMCPGIRKLSVLAWGEASRATVCARSAAEIPVVVPSRASTDTVNAVPWGSVFRDAMGASPRASARSGARGAQMSPRPKVAMKFTISGVAFSAAAKRSPSFSLSSSSTTMIMRPARSSSKASSTEQNTDPSSAPIIFHLVFPPSPLPGEIVTL